MKATKASFQTPSNEIISLSSPPPKLNKLPIVRTKYKEMHSQNKKLALYGSKYFSKVSVLGEQTPQTLKNLIRCKTLKYFREFEFDAYLCDSSGLKRLSKVLNKYKGSIINLNLIIRRVEAGSELNIISSCISKLNRLIKLRIEFARTEKVSNKDLLSIAKACPRCYMLKSLDLIFIWLMEVGQEGYSQFIKRFGRLKKLEHIKFYPLSFYQPSNEFKDLEVKYPKLPVKSFHVRNAAKTGWTSMTDGQGEFLPKYIRSFGEGINPIKFSYTLHKFPVSIEALQALSEVLPKFTNTKEVFITLDNCKLNEVEIFVVAEGIMKSPQIEQLTFKVIEYSHLDPEFIVEIVSCLSSLSFLKKLNLLFRKLKYSRQETINLSDSISNIPGIEYTFGKNSLHVFKG